MIMFQRTNITSGEIVSHKLTHADREASLLDASRLVRKSGTAELLVTAEAGGVEKLRRFQDSQCEALAVLDGEGRLRCGLTTTR